jgi:RNA-directed DNA polymerase
LQWLLTHSFAAKLLAVKRVTENSGKNTPGVDGVLWKFPTQKRKAAKSLSRKGYIVKPLRRVYIKKKNGKERPLGIPTMKDRAMQALFLSALDPVSETTADLSLSTNKLSPSGSNLDLLTRTNCFLQRKEPHKVV